VGSESLPVDIEPIGVVRVPLTDDEVRDSWITGGVNGVVEVFPKYEEGLLGIEGFSHIILITWLHKARPWHRAVLKVKPRRLSRFGVPLSELPLIGVFCSDSPDRPNPIGLSIVRLVRRDGRYLHVSGLDLFDGTPVLDIKAYTPDRAIYDVRVPKWYLDVERLAERYLGRRVSV